MCHSLLGFGYPRRRVLIPEARIACRLLFGYAMPAFECFKTVETRPNDAHMLRFWCQYW
jgi:hypothetical protein